MNKSYSTLAGLQGVGRAGATWLRTLNGAAFGRLVMLVVVLTTIGLTAAFAQNRAVTGTVNDISGSGLPGVNVTIKGTTRGTQTDADGNYKITDVPANATLVFSFVGFVTREVEVGAKSTVTVTLADDSRSLNEVVVIGYGTQKSKDATGSVATISPKDFNKGVISSPENLLQGRVAGVQITQSSGEPGAAININIRGVSSLRSGNNPLFVVDGFPLDGGNTSTSGSDFGAGSTSARNPLAFINPGDIENISVLKDASAAAIYGARGANGVVLITTKRGRSGQPEFSFSANASASGSLKRYDLLNRDAFLAGVKATGGDPTAVDKGANTNWQDAILQTGITQNYNLGFGGGNNTTNYRFSLGYQDQQGIIKTSGFQRITGRINASHKLFNDKVIIDLSGTSTNVTDKYVQNTNNAGYQGSLIGAALQANPTYPTYNKDGTPYQPGGDFRNPVALLDYVHDKGVTDRNLVTAAITWKIVEGLSLKANFGIDNSNSTRRTALDARLNAIGYNVNLTSNVSVPVYQHGGAQIATLNRQSKLVEYTLNYNHKVGPGQLDALAGFSYQKFENKASAALAANFIAPYDQINYLDNFGAVNAQSSVSYGANSAAGVNDLQSFFGRANYNLQDKYLLTATLRVDGSSRFGLNNKYGYFPSFAAAWRLSNESFIPKNIFNDLKLRANYGTVGNQDFAGGTSKIIFALNSDGSTSQQNNPNPDIKWESATTFGAGLDFTILKGKLTGSIDYFNKSTTNTLFQVFYAQPAPVTYKWVNLPGQIVNSGVELVLGYQAVQKPGFNWEILGNVTFLKNIVKNFGSSVIPTGPIDGQGLTGAYAQTVRDGYSAFTFFTPTWTGFDSQGLGTYADGGRNAAQGSPIPNTFIGLTNNFSFGKFSASLFVDSKLGAVVYNNTANALFLKGALKNGRNVTTDAANSPENPLNSGSVSSRFIEKADFVRISNASVGYNVSLPSSSMVKSLRFSVTGQNLFIFTGYTGLNPDVNTPKTLNNIPSLGIDYAAYPTPRTFTVGLTAGF